MCYVLHMGVYVQHCFMRDYGYGISKVSVGFHGGCCWVGLIGQTSKWV